MTRYQRKGTSEQFMFIYREDVNRMIREVTHESSEEVS